MRALIRDHDWSTSPLGEPDEWPGSLLSIIDLMLGSKFPMFIAWGTELGFLYNDAYAEVLGAKHPHALGGRFREVWSEIWSEISPLVDAALAGEATYREDLPLVLNRHGVAEDAWFTFSYSPVRDESGKVAGMFCVVAETTAKVKAALSLRAREADMDEAQRLGRIGSWRWDMESDETVASDELLRIFGLCPGTEVLPLFQQQRGSIYPLDSWELLAAAVDEALQTGAGYELDLSAFRAREPIWITTRGEVFRDGSGRVVGLRGTVQDITGRKAAEAAVAESEARFRNMADHSPVMMWVTDPTGHCTYLNARWYEFTGQALGTGEGAGWLEAVHPGDRAAAEQAFLDANAQQRNYRVDFRLRRADGAYRWAIDAAAARFSDDGTYLGYVGSVLDIDDRREAERALAESEERLRLATENAEVGFWDVDVVNDTLIWPGRVKAMFGIAADAPVSMTDFYEGLHLDDREATAAAFDAAADPQRRALYDVEYRTVGKDDGRVRWVAAKGRGVFEGDRCTRVIGTAVDITARKQAAARFEGVFNSDLMGFTIFDIHTGETIAINNRFLEMTGHSRADFEEGRWDWRDFTPPEHLAKDEAAISQARQGGWWHPYEKEYWRRDGSVFPVRVAGAPLPGEPGRVVVSIEDITDRKAAELRLRELNDSLESQVAQRTEERDRMWRATRDLMCIAKVDGTLLSVNPAWERLLGWTEAELVGRIAIDIKHPDDLERTREGLARLAAGEPVDGFEDRYRHKDGGWRWISWSIEPAGDLMYCAGRDITADKRRQAELEEAQEALRQSQKMEAMGQLTGGVAHDFNNLLTPIVGSLDLLQRRGVGTEREQRLIEGAAQSAERAKTLVQRLLAFARRQPLQPVPVDVADLIHGMTDLIQSTIGPQIRVVVEVAGGLPPARADRNQLEMALLNLAVNARDAMPAGGILTISARAGRGLGAITSEVEASRFLTISVTDTGTGMDEATLARAIEPFFSTKGIGKGTGLGLSMVHGLASQLGGGLSIESQLGQGTAVTLTLPMSAAVVASGSSSALPSMEARIGLALLVDDEDLVRASTAEMLAELGYGVVEAETAEAALGLLDQGLRPDLLITDHLMPGMTGTELVRRVWQLQPDLPALVISGYAEVEGVTLDMHRLSKPFRQSELARSLSLLKQAD